MADFRTADSIGARIAAVRKLRGMKNGKDLADAIPNDTVTESIIRNIEAGRKSDLAIAQLLNIAWALRVSPMLLLAPMGNPYGHPDLPNLTDELRELTIAEFDAWAGGITGGDYRATSADERNERAQVEALHELLRERRALRRLTTVFTLETETPTDNDRAGLQTLSSNTEEQIAETTRRIQEIEEYLTSAGWNVDQAGSTSPPKSVRRIGRNGS